MCIKHQGTTTTHRGETCFEFRTSCDQILTYKYDYNSHYHCQRKYNNEIDIDYRIHLFNKNNKLT